MSGVNKVILVGRLGGDPETKAAGNTTATRFSIATSETWEKNGQKQERVEWHKITVWGKMGESCQKYLKKGRQAYIEGKLQTDSWEDNGVKKWSTSVIAQTVQFLGSADSSGGQREDPPLDQQDSGGGGFDASQEGPL